MLPPIILEWASVRGILHVQKPMGGHKTQMFLLSPSPQWEFELDEREVPSNSACLKKKKIYIYESHIPDVESSVSNLTWLLKNTRIGGGGQISFLNAYKWQALC